MANRYRKPVLKDGELRMYYGKLPGDEPDLILAWQGDRSMKRDTALLHAVICCQHPDPPSSGASFWEVPAP